MSFIMFLCQVSCLLCNSLTFICLAQPVALLNRKSQKADVLKQSQKQSQKADVLSKACKDLESLCREQEDKVAFLLDS